MKKIIAILAVMAACISLFSAIAPGLLARQAGMMHASFGFSVVESIIKWITTSVEDFECGTRRNTSVIQPGDVILARHKAWEPWWNDSWKYRMIFIIRNNGSALHDYQIPISLTPETFDYSKADENGSDIRFVDENGTLLPYWIEKWGNISKIWVKLDIPKGNKTIYMYYGNKNAEPYSNGSRTFIFFDDFENTIPWNENGMWHTTTRRSHSGNHSKWYGNESTGNYDNGSRNYGNLISMPFNASSCILELWMWRSVEYYQGQYDITAIYDSPDGSNWNQIWYNDSSNPSTSQWKFLSIKMNQNARYIRFYFDTVDDINNGYEGWYIDDVRVRQYASPPPVLNAAMEESQGSWKDYFGGDGAIQEMKNVSEIYGKISLKYGALHSRIYNFTGISSPSNSHVARYDVGNAILEPASLFNSTGSEFTTAAYDAIAKDDGYVAYSVALNGNISQHIFKFRIDVPKEAITTINISWKGYSEYLYRFLWWTFWIGFTTPDGFRIWNFSSNQWDVIGDIPSSNAVVWHMVKPLNYIKNGSMYVMAYAYRDGRTVRIYTDYVEINITYASYVNNGSIDSILINPSNSSWDKFYARCGIPDETNITFILFNMNGSLLCKINGSESYGYNISFIKDKAIRIHAELESNNESITPFIYEWNITFLPHYYKYGWIESYSHDCGNGTIYGNITWNATLTNATYIEFQIASSVDGINWTPFVGPDGKNDTYYVVSSRIWNGHNGARYIRYRAYLHGNGYATPILHDVTITYYG